MAGLGSRMEFMKHLSLLGEGSSLLYSGFKQGWWDKEQECLGKWYS